MYTKSVQRLSKLCIQRRVLEWMVTMFSEEFSDICTLLNLSTGHVNYQFIIQERVYICIVNISDAEIPRTEEERLGIAH